MSNSLRHRHILIIEANERLLSDVLSNISEDVVPYEIWSMLQKLLKRLAQEAKEKKQDTDQYFTHELTSQHEVVDGNTSVAITSVLSLVSNIAEKSQLLMKAKQAKDNNTFTTLIKQSISDIGANTNVLRELNIAVDDIIESYMLFSEDEFTLLHQTSNKMSENTKKLIKLYKDAQSHKSTASDNDLTKASQMIARLWKASRDPVKFTQELISRGLDINKLSLSR